MRRLGLFRVWIFVAIALAALPCLAGEVAVLKNGFSIRYERREIVGASTRLYVNTDGSSFVDVPTAQVDHFEAAPDDAASGSRLPASGSQTWSSGSQLAASGFNATSFSGSSAANVNDLVDEASGRYRLDPDFVNSVIKAESGFNVRAVSPKGAQGLMQLMPGTASALGVTNAFDPRANVEGGTKYLRELLERYNFDMRKALAAYNAGPQRVEQFGGIPPYYETRAYVARVVKDFNKKKAAKKGSTAKHTSGGERALASKHAAQNVVQAKAGTAEASH